NNMTTFVTEARRMRPGRLPMLKKEDLGYTDVGSVKIIGEEGVEPIDLTPTIEYVQPDDGNPYDQTVMKVTLPQPLPPQQTIKLDISFTAKLPLGMARTGFRDDYFFVAQWFPKIGVFYEGAWNCHQYHTTSEFFADYGIYDVSLTLPSPFILGATGMRRYERDNGDGTTTYNYYQEDVHDFVWTASPHYLVYEDTFTHEYLPEVKIILLLQPYHKMFKDRYIEATKSALRYYGEWYGAYPYPQVTCVDPAYRSGSGGMEYPTLFTGGAYWLTPIELRSPEGVTIHECGHGWWYGIVGNNEFEDAWMDEGFNSYSDDRVVEKAYGPYYFSRRFLQIFPIVFKRFSYKPGWGSISDYRSFAKLDNMSRLAWEFMDGTSYGTNSYDKGSLMLWTLENYLGPELSAKVFKTYFQRWKFRHPRPQDFIDVVEEVTGQDMSWYFDQIVYGSNELDYAIERISSSPVAKKEGYFDEEKERTFITGEEEGEKEEKEEVIYESNVIVRRLGEVVFPVEVLVTFENGEQEKKVWDGEYRWVRYTFKKPTRLQSAEVDPDHKIFLDVNYTNNSKTMNPQKLPAYKWAFRWMFWLQHFLETFTFFS
ncbi:MAG: M1 family metallopeptidase, partial [Nitrospinota bacterium]|nr:M1 family metallopeptidase [Nitrospinota bacterium]